MRKLYKQLDLWLEIQNTAFFKRFYQADLKSSFLVFEEAFSWTIPQYSHRFIKIVYSCLSVLHYSKLWNLNLSTLTLAFILRIRIIFIVYINIILFFHYFISISLFFLDYHANANSLKIPYGNFPKGASSLQWKASTDSLLPGVPRISSNTSLCFFHQSWTIVS